MPRLTLPLGAVSLALLLSACSSGVPTVAQITTIDRTCTIIERSYKMNAAGEKQAGTEQEVDRYKGDCNEIDGWEEVKRKRDKLIDGTADVHFAYTGPDGKSHNGTLTFNGRDDEFYTLKAGDELNIRVAEDNPARVWRC